MVPTIQQFEERRGTATVIRYEVLDPRGEVWARTWDKDFADYCLEILIKRYQNSLDKSFGA
jgi:hypothetical protein